MFTTKRLAWVVLAVAAIATDAVQLEGRTIEEFSEFLQKTGNQLCARRSGLTLDSIDPLSLDTFTSRAGDFVVDNKNAVLTGLSNATLSNLKWLDKNTGSVQVSANVTLTSDYAAAGKLLFLPMSSSGKMAVNIYDLKANVTFTFKKVLINSIEYMVIEKLKSVYSIGPIQFDMKSDGNCFPADTLANSALNANSRLFEPAAAKEIAPIIDGKVKDELNLLIKDFPAYELIGFSY